jgi:hypothetical protein
MKRSVTFAAVAVAGLALGAGIAGLPDEVPNDLVIDRAPSADVTATAASSTQPAERPVTTTAGASTTLPSGPATGTASSTTVAAVEAPVGSTRP